jgi:predicted secreted protein
VYSIKTALQNNVETATFNDSSDCKIYFILKMTVYWVVAPFSLRADDAGSKHLLNVGKLLQIHGATTQKTVIFILAAVRTLNLTYISYYFLSTFCPPKRFLAQLLR